MITIILNGKTKQLESGTSLATLLQSENFTGKTFAVAVNKAFVPNSQHTKRIIRENDDIEIVVPTQGG